MDLFVVPIDSTKGIKMLYVFVDIKLDATHFLETVRHNFEAGASLAIVSTIQFVATLQVRDLFFCFLNSAIGWGWVVVGIHNSSYICNHY